MIEVHQREYGTEGAVAMARSRRGGQFDPAVVNAFAADPSGVLAVPSAGDVAAPRCNTRADRNTRLDSQSLDSLLVALGDFVDLKCPFTLGHLGRSPSWRQTPPSPQDWTRTVTLTRRAAWVHDIGRIGL